MKAVRSGKWIATIACLLSAACQQPAQKTYGDGEDPAAGGVASGGGKSKSTQLVTVPVELQDATQGGAFSLADADAFTISLVGCASGYTASADEDSTALQVYKFDRTCLGKLTTFEFGGHTLIPTAADPFTTWLAGDTATFDEVGEPGTYAVSVSVISQLASPVSGSESIVYQFSELDKGADKSILEATVGDGHPLVVASQPPPSFTIHSVAFTGVTAGGAGQFVFTMECTSPIVGDVCESVDMADLTYKLVEDTFTADTLVVGEANALFPAGETAVTMPADKEALGATTVNGGFHTVTLDGPLLMASHRNMIFIMQSANVSYQYFNVDVATLTQD